MSTTEPHSSTQPADKPAKNPLFTKAFFFISLINLTVFTGWQMTMQGLPLVIAGLGATNIQIGLCTTLATVAMLIVRPFVGAMLDVYGRKGFMLAGFITLTVVDVLYLLCPFAGAILMLRVIHGFGWGFGSTANATLAADIFPRDRFAEGMGWFGLTNSFAMAVGPALSLWLIGAGLANEMLVIASGLSLLSIGAAVMVFKCDIKQMPRKPKPQHVFQLFKLKNMFEKSAIFPAVVCALMCMNNGAVSSFLALMGAERGVTSVSMFFVCQAIVTAITRPVLGRVVDKHGYYWAGILSCLTAAIAITILVFADTLLLFCVAGALLGLGLGTGMSAFNSMAVAAAPPESRGAATSTFLMSFNLGMSVGALLAGILVGIIGYAGTFGVMAGFQFVALIVFLSGGRARIEAYHQKSHG